VDLVFFFLLLTRQKYEIVPAPHRPSRGKLPKTARGKPPKLSQPDFLHHRD